MLEPESLGHSITLISTQGAALSRTLLPALIRKPCWYHPWLNSRGVLRQSEGESRCADSQEDGHIRWSQVWDVKKNTHKKRRVDLVSSLDQIQKMPLGWNHWREAPLHSLSKKLEGPQEVSATAHLRNAEAEPKNKSFRRNPAWSFFFTSVRKSRLQLSVVPPPHLVKVLFAWCDNTGQRSQQQISASPQPRNSLCVTDLSAAARPGQLISWAVNVCPAQIKITLFTVCLTFPTWLHSISCISQPLNWVQRLSAWWLFYFPHTYRTFKRSPCNLLAAPKLPHLLISHTCFFLFMQGWPKTAIR